MGFIIDQEYTCPIRIVSRYMAPEPVVTTGKVFGSGGYAREWLINQLEGSFVVLPYSQVNGSMACKW